MRIDVPAALRPLPVPALLLQPLVENAVKHGDRAEPVAAATCAVEARLDAANGSQTLVLAVRNSGAPLSVDPDARAGARRRWTTSSAAWPATTATAATLVLSADARRAPRPKCACRPARRRGRPRRRPDRTAG